VTDGRTTIIVTGSRNADREDVPFVRAQLARSVDLMFPSLWNYPELIIFRHGACHLGGVDAIADHAAVDWGWKVEAHPAMGHPTENFGPWPACGPRRNEYMCSLGADLVIGFPDQASQGTWGCLRAAARYGLVSLVYGLPTRVRGASYGAPGHVNQ
jgi:hypothetical protein